jgi:phosphoribosylglycinamide formyltransferase
MKLLTACLGQFDGANAIERAFDAFQTGNLENNKTGIMVHHVIKQVDQGDVIMMREVECHKGEDLQQLRERIQSQEHKLIVEATAHVVRETLANRQ